MITRELGSHNPIAALLAHFGDELYIKYKVPPFVRDTLKMSDRAGLSLTGSRDNLEVYLVTPHGAFSFENAIQDLQSRPKFVLYPDLYKVSTYFGEGTINIPAKAKHRSTLPYGLMHAVARLRLQETDPESHRVSLDAHNVLNQKGSLVHLQAYRHLQLKGDALERRTQLDAWKTIGQEEIRVASIALNALEELYEAGIDPLPHITTLAQLEDLVNGNHVLRTLKQYEINPYFLQSKGIPMALDTKYISTYFERIQNYRQKQRGHATS